MPKTPAASPAHTPTGARWFDAAAVLTLATATLYTLGWTYWSAFFVYFGLSVNIVGLTFAQVVSTTWLYALLIIVAAAAQLSHTLPRALP